MKRKLGLIVLIIILSIVASTLCACEFLDSLDNLGKTNISECQISIDQELYEYTGEEIRPQVSIVCDEKTLVEGVDYELTFSDNIELGIAKITIDGIGNYYGQSSIEFKIVSHIYVYQFECDIEGFEYEGSLIQKVESKSDVVFPDISAKGYEFKSWVVNGVEIDENVNALPDEGGIIYAQLVPIEYTITYHIDGGINNSLNPLNYTIEDDIQWLSPTRGNDYFAGWYLDEEFTQRIESITAGTMTGDIHLYAKFVADTYKKITYVVPEGADFVEYDMYLPNESISVQEVLSEDKTQELVWYSDKEFTTKYIFRTMPNDDIAVYARWEDVLDEGFLDSMPDNSIDSYRELVDYIEYICFYNVQYEQSQLLNITYISGSDNIKEQISLAIQECTFPRMGSMKYSSSDSQVRIYLAQDLLDQEASVSGTAKEDYYNQYGDVMFYPQSTRSQDYDDFAINYVDKTFECSTSNQLFYVLSHGYRPLPMAGSDAEYVYEQFKDIMRGICDDSMTDFEKVKNIYEWLVLNVYYDNYVASGGDPNISYYKYKAFYLEGVLEGSAVCDGISKAFSVMCAIEGIDCVRVTGQQNDSNIGHAWNKVQIMGAWYLSDATWGNLSFVNNSNPNEVVNFEYLLLSDSTRKNIDGYDSNNYTYYQTNDDFGSYEVFDMIEVEIDGYVAELLIDSAEELSYVLEYAYNEYVDEDNCTLNFMVNYDCDMSELINEAIRLLRRRTSILQIYDYQGIFKKGEALENGQYPKGTQFWIIF